MKRTPEDILKHIPCRETKFDPLHEHIIDNRLKHLRPRDESNFIRYRSGVCAIGRAADVDEYAYKKVSEKDMKILVEFGKEVSEIDAEVARRLFLIRYEEEINARCMKAGMEFRDGSVVIDRVVHRELLEHIERLCKCNWDLWECVLDPEGEPAVTVVGGVRVRRIDVSGKDLVRMWTYSRLGRIDDIREVWDEFTIEYFAANAKLARGEMNQKEVGLSLCPFLKDFDSLTVVFMYEIIERTIRETIVERAAAVGIEIIFDDEMTMRFANRVDRVVLDEISKEVVSGKINAVRWDEIRKSHEADLE